jgi:DNA modification methylase
MNPKPLIWAKPDNKGILPDWRRGPRQIYETALFGSRGDRLIVRAKSNLVPAPTDQSEDHLSVKPIAVLHEFFEMFVDKSTRMLDPTCGSGTALRAAEALDAAYVLGIEVDKEFAERARSKNRGGRSPKSGLRHTAMEPPTFTVKVICPSPIDRRSYSSR